MKKVAFVDDSKTVLLTAKVALKNMIDNGIIELLEFDNPLEFLEKIENGLKVDLIITDINMPQLNGFDLVKKLKENKDYKTKPILALTTENSAEIKAKGKELGLSGWVTKSFDPSKLEMAVKRVLKIR